MATKAFRGGNSLSIGDGATPEVFTPIGEITSCSPIGSQLNLLDATSWDSGDAMEYVAGMKDGSEITIETMFVEDDPGQLEMVDAQGTTTNMRLVLKRGLTDVYTRDFAVTHLGYDYVPGAQPDLNKRSFRMKITGEILDS